MSEDKDKKDLELSMKVLHSSFRLEDMDPENADVINLKKLCHKISCWINNDGHEADLEHAMNKFNTIGKKLDFPVTF